MTTLTQEPAAAPAAATIPEPVLAVEGLVRRFGSTTAVDHLDFAVLPGETFGLLGHNGAGKTTTIRVVNGVIRRDEGRVAVFGVDPATDGEVVRRRTGVLTETPSVDERLTGRENLEFHGRLYGVGGRRLRDQVGALLDAFGLEGRAHDRAAGYSRGMKQRLALARTLVHDPDLLFLDEPTAALDPVAARGVHELVDNFRRDQKRTVVMTTHNLVEAERLCDRVVILRNGAALATGRPTELARAPGAGTVVEIEVAPRELEQAPAALAAAGLAEVDAAGGRVTARLTSRDDIPGVVAALVGAGISVYRVVELEPDLESAYFALHERPLGDGERGTTP